MICPNCGKKLAEEEQLCSHCGERLPRHRSARSVQHSLKVRTVGGDSGLRNKRLKVTVAIIVVVCLLGVGGYLAFFLLSGRGDSNGKLTTQEMKERYQQIEKTGSSANNMYWELEKDKGKQAAQSATVEWLEEQEGVAEAGAVDTCIWCRMEYGEIFTIETELQEGE